MDDKTLIGVAYDTEGRRVEVWQDHQATRIVAGDSWYFFDRSQVQLVIDLLGVADDKAGDWQAAAAEEAANE